MKNRDISMGDKPSSGSDASNQFQKPDDNDTIDMFAEQLAQLLLDCVLYQRAAKLKKSRRRQRKV